MSWSIIGTWGFSYFGLEKAKEVLTKGGSAELAIELAVRDAEDNPLVKSVGLNGIPNREGFVELDAAFMRGTDLAVGGVSGIRRYANPIVIARSVMNEEYNFLAGEGAELYAKNMGLDYVEKLPECSHSDDEGHDTVGVIAIDQDGVLCAGTSTSGTGYKHLGRIGDSPLIGSGFYADNAIGGAVATGQGEDIMRMCAAYHAVTLIKHGMTPQQAAEETVSYIHNRIMEARGAIGNVALICMDRYGNYGAASNHDQFDFCYASDTKGLIHLEGATVVERHVEVFEIDDLWKRKLSERKNERNL